MTHLLVITHGKGAYSAPYHLADENGKSRCGFGTDRHTLIDDTPAHRLGAQNRGQYLCVKCDAWETRQANDEAKLRTPKIAKWHAAELAALARWNAAAKGAPLP